MCSKIIHGLVIVLCIAAAGCAKDYHLQLEETTPLYVIEGRISTLEGPYCVRVTKTSNQFDLQSLAGDSAVPVRDALVIISDDAGTVDTLIPVDQARFYRYWYIVKDDGSLDSFQHDYSSQVYTKERGYYQTTRIKGVPGRTYHLEVQAGQQVFHASAYMPSTPAIDSAVIKETVVIPEGGKGYLPHVYFKEPENEKNYYLLQYNEVHWHPYEIHEKPYAWELFFPYYVVDDKLLPSYVNGLAVRLTVSGHTPYSGSNWFGVTPNGPLHVKLSSLTKEAYEYYKVLISQFENDGNAYKPVPASAAGNISNGALGFFYATHVSGKLILR